MGVTVTVERDSPDRMLKSRNASYTGQVRVSVKEEAQTKHSQGSDFRKAADAVRKPQRANAFLK